MPAPALLRPVIQVLNYPIPVKPATPRVRRAFWTGLALWLLVNLADMLTTALILAGPLARGARRAGEALAAGWLQEVDGLGRKQRHAEHPGK